MNKAIDSSPGGTDVIVRNARLSGEDGLQTIVVSQGKVKSIVPSGTDESLKEKYGSHQLIDANENLAVCGFVDHYTRLREPGFARKGTIGSESSAALRAGFTRILCSPDTSPAIDSVATVELVRQHASQGTQGAKVLPLAALTVALQGEHLSELATLKAAGCPAASQADMPLLNTKVLYSAMRYAASFEFPLLLTARDAHLGSEGCAHTGAIATRLGLPQIPVAAETVSLATIIELCRETACRTHVSRISTARAVEQIFAAKQSGLPISCDVGIHHLFYTDEFLAGYDSAFHSAVPFRSRKDRDALRAGLQSGVIDTICSDHAPHDIDAGLAPFPETEPGLSAYDWFIPLLMQVPRACGLTLDQLIPKLSSSSTDILADRRPATIQVENTADFFLLDPEASPACKSELLSAGHNNPLATHETESLDLQPLKGCVNAVIMEHALHFRT
ncbi:MAG: dihydroorotase [Granulosicoccus sp.]